MGAVRRHYDIVGENATPSFEHLSIEPLVDAANSIGKYFSILLGLIVPGVVTFFRERT